MNDLEKRAEEYVNKTFPTFKTTSLKKCFVDFAQQETELLSKHLLEMQKTNGTLTDRVNELEKEIDEREDECHRCVDKKKDEQLT